MHCKHGCLIYCHTAAFSMSIRLPFQEWGPTPLINNKGLTLQVADKGLIPLVCDAPLTSTGLACRPQSNPKGKPSLPTTHLCVGPFSRVICKGQQNTRRKGPMMNASRWLANTNKYFPAPKPNIKSHTHGTPQMARLTDEKKHKPSFSEIGRAHV